MLKALNLPKGAKEELNYPPEIADKIIKGEPLWKEDEGKNDDENDEDNDFEDDEANKKKSTGLTMEQKLLLTMFGEGKFHLIPSFFRTLIFLKK